MRATIGYYMYVCVCNGVSSKEVQCKHHQLCHEMLHEIGEKLEFGKPTSLFR